MNRILVTGANGQFGSYFLDKGLENNCQIYGLVRRSSVDTLYRIKHLLNSPNLKLIEGDITDTCCIFDIIKTNQFDAIINTAAQSHVASSFSQPILTTTVDYLGFLNILEAVKQYSTHSKVIQCSTSELFGSNINKNGEQNEQTPLSPNSPYGVAKLASHELIRIYRTAYNLKVCGPIMFNYESPRRGENFVSRKITRYIGKVIVNGFKNKLQMGNINSYRDWSHCKDTVEAIWLLLNSEYCKEFVIGSGKAHSVEEFLNLAFNYAGLGDYRNYIEINPEFIRPFDVPYLKSDPSLARKYLGWEPKITFENLVREMVDYDICLAKSELK